MSNRILVALDPFAKDQTNLKKAMTTTKALAKALDGVVEPLAVVSPDQLQWPNQFDGTWVSQFKEAARSGLKKVAAVSGLKADKIEIIEQPVHSLRASVESLATEAEARDPKALVVFTHHRRNPGVRIFGSFATALLAKSKVPMIFVNAKGKEIKSVKTVVFASDLSPESETAFQSVLGMAEEMGAKVILFHALTPITQEVYASTGIMGGFANYEIYVHDEESRATEAGQRWLEIAKKMGVDCRFVINHANFRASHAIMDSSKRLKADMIAVCSKTVGFEAFIVGSVTRDLIEDSKLPVIVIPTVRAKQEAQARRAKRETRASTHPAQ